MDLFIWRWAQVFINFYVNEEMSEGNAQDIRFFDSNRIVANETIYAYCVVLMNDRQFTRFRYVNNELAMLLILFHSSTLFPT